jgi:putative effector of murein hydrolase LrgA (UPF0299 family)
MLEALTLILVCQLIGEACVLFAGLPVPGPVLGMLLLLAWLFVPAGVGVLVHWERVRGQWAAIAAALVLGTLVTLAVTAVTMLAVSRLIGRGGGDGA